MILEKITLYSACNDLKYYIRTYNINDGKPINVITQGPMPKYIQDDMVHRIMDNKTRAHTENQTLPEARYITEMGLTYFK